MFTTNVWGSCGNGNRAGSGGMKILDVDILRGRVGFEMTSNIDGKRLSICWIDKNIEMVYEG